MGLNIGALNLSLETYINGYIRITFLLDFKLYVETVIGLNINVEYALIKKGYMPFKVLHEQQGLKIVKNERNSFCVCTLHFSADPAKRSPEWAREAAVGMTPEKFSREYSIDYTAVMGAKVFPEITSNRGAIVIPEPYPDFGPGVKYWGGLDYGTNNPSSFHIYTIVDGITYSIWELYGAIHPNRTFKNIGDFVAEMRKFKYFNQLRWIAADCNIWSDSNPQKDGTVISVHELFYREGIRNMVQGRQDEEAWIALMRQHWQNQEDPTFRIFERCANQIREFETSIYVNQSERQLLTSAYSEKMVDKDNHSLDDCKYFMLSRPNAATTTQWTSPNMISQWSLPGTARRGQPTPQIQTIKHNKPVGGDGKTKGYI